MDTNTKEISDYLLAKYDAYASRWERIERIDIDGRPYIRRIVKPPNDHEGDQTVTPNYMIQFKD